MLAGRATVTGCNLVRDPAGYHRSLRGTATGKMEMRELTTDRTLMRSNLDRISTRSVRPDELDEQRKILEAAERKLVKVERDYRKLRETIAGLGLQLAEARSLNRERETPQTKRSLASLAKKLDSALQRRDSMSSDYRELKMLVRDQRAVCRGLVKKEEARQKAVARFLREWERNYDREIRMKEKTVRKRERMRRT